MDLSRRTYTVKETMQITGLSRDAIYEALRAKRIAGIKITKNWQVLREPLDRQLRDETGVK